jgi:diguanylate cyclase (GGDEF)-like protein
MNFEIRNRQEFIRATLVTVFLSILLSNILVFFFEGVFSPPVTMGDYLGATVIGGIASTLASTIIFSQTYQLSLAKNKSQEQAERLLEMQQTLRKHAETDSLTGLANRRMFFEALEKEISRYERNQRPFSMLLIDIDQFKKVNDTYGHIVGDHVLQELAKIFEEEARNQDLVARTGGEEFCFLLPETTREAARFFGERIRERTSKTLMDCEISREPAFIITISIGIAEIQENEDVDQIYNRADMALYHAKTAGRNQVKISKK